VPAGLILHRLKLCEQGHAIGAKLLTTRHSVVVAKVATIGRDGYNLVRVTKRVIQATGVDDTHEKGE
jgi:hypothetical protein